MTQTTINGATQIRAASVTSDRLVDNTVADGKLAESYLKVDGTRAMNGNLDLDGNKIVYVGTPTDTNDAATKGYVDGLIQGFDWKASVRAASAANGTLSSAFKNGSVIDGVTLETGDRILIKDQTTASENGIYTVNANGAPTRTDDANDNSDFTAGLTVFVSEGTLYGNSSWTITTNDPIDVGTSAVVFTQVAGGSLYTAGDGLTLTGSAFSVTAADASLSVGLSGVQVALGDGSLEVDGGLKVVSGTAGDVYIADASGTLTPTTLSGDVQNVSDTGGVELAPAIARIAQFRVRETPSGSINGSNTTFLLADMPQGNTEQVFLNGLLQEPGSGNDYTIAGIEITMADAPVAGDRLRVCYIVAPS
ncbi:MAG: hypothetical protein ACR2JI_05090 [Mycobacterium sp.]